MLVTNNKAVGLECVEIISEGAGGDVFFPPGSIGPVFVINGSRAISIALVGVSAMKHLRQSGRSVGAGKPASARAIL